MSKHKGLLSPQIRPGGVCRFHLGISASKQLIDIDLPCGYTVQYCTPGVALSGYPPPFDPPTKWFTLINTRVSSV